MQGRIGSDPAKGLSPTPWRPRKPGQKTSRRMWPRHWPARAQKFAAMSVPNALTKAARHCPASFWGMGMYQGSRKGTRSRYCQGSPDVLARRHMETDPGVRAQVADAGPDEQAPPRAAATRSSAAPRGPGSWRSQKLSYSSRQVCSSNSLSAICKPVQMLTNTAVSSFPRDIRRPGKGAAKIRRVKS